MKKKEEGRSVLTERLEDQDQGRSLFEKYEEEKMTKDWREFERA